MADIKLNLGQKVGNFDSDTPATPDAPPAPTVNETIEEAPVQIMYSVHPMQSYKIGNYQFTNSVLILRSEKEERGFLRAIADLPIHEKSRIRKVDAGFIVSMLGQTPAASQMYDTGAERKALEQLIAQNPIVG